MKKSSLGVEERMESERKNSSLHVAMFPFFAFGHISPFVQLSNKLSSHGVHISFFSPQPNVTRIRSMLHPSPSSHIVPLTLPPVPGLPSGLASTSDLTPSQSELLKVALDLMQPQIRQLLSQLKPHFVLFDFAQEWLPKMASDLGIKTVFYSVFIALSTAFLTVPARLPEPGTYPALEQVKNPPPGFPATSVAAVKTFQARDFLYMFKSFHDGPCVYDRVISGLKGSSIILAKTCNQMEAPGLPFLLVLNFPANADASAELGRALPEGLMERVKGKGVISSGWVEQQKILAHSSVGCYLSHAGFSSVMEGLLNDCQLVLLPQKGDQFLNSKLVSGDLRAGVEVNRRDEDGYFGKEDIKRAVESVMVRVDEEPGKSVRGNHKKWREFVVDKGVQDSFIVDLVKEMEAIARISNT